MHIFPYTFSGPTQNQADIGTYIKAAKKDYSNIHEFTTRTRKKESICIYRILKNNKVYLGFVALCNIEEYAKGNIVKHELTISHKQQNQKMLLETRNALIKPIILTYEPINELEEMLQRYCVNHKADEFYLLKDGSIHEKWMVSKKKWIKRIQEQIEPVSTMYIADGHHRSAAFYSKKKENPKDKSHNKIMSAFFSLKNLDIKSFHRVITDEQIVSNPIQLMDRLGEIFDITDYEDPRAQVDIDLKKHDLLLYYPDRWMKLSWKAHILKESKSPLLLDADLFNEYVCEKIFHCKDIREDSRINYIFSTSGIPELIEQTHIRNHSIAFVLPRMSKDEFYALVKEETILPPKSTLFEPRLKNGLIIQEL